MKENVSGCFFSEHSVQSRATPKPKQPDKENYQLNRMKLEPGLGTFYARESDPTDHIRGCIKLIFIAINGKIGKSSILTKIPTNIWHMYMVHCGSTFGCLQIGVGLIGRPVNRNTTLILRNPLLLYGYNTIHPVPDQVTPSFVIFDIRALTLTRSLECQSARMSKITNDGLTRSRTGCSIYPCSIPHPYDDSRRQRVSNEAQRERERTATL